jgi:SAM-dependent methyltransferase
MAIARERARRRGLDGRITWRVGSLLKLPSWGLGLFDYVNCSGVLHHLPDPAAGLAALRAVLKDDGLMGVMVYGAYGRSAIYPLQELLRRLLPGVEEPRERVRAARELLASLPATNLLSRTLPELLPGDLDSDAGLYDLLLHSLDRPLTVPGLYGLLRSAGLRLVEFVPDSRAFYDPRFVLQSPELLQRTRALPREEQQAVAELAWGCLSRHAFWASPRSDSIADPADPENVPFFFGPHHGAPRVAAALQALVAGEPGAFALGGGGMPPLTARLTFSEAACRFLRLVDGERTMGEIASRLAASGEAPLPIADARRVCVDVFETLRVADAILLRHVSVTPLAWPSGA